MPRGSSRRFGVTALLLSLAAPPTWGRSEADLERAKRAFQAGAAAYAAGEYLTAIQALDTAYALTPLPAIAFSLAQAERRQYFVGHDPAHLERAIRLYREYLERVPAGGRRADALDALSQLEPLAAIRKQSQETESPSAADSVRRTRLMIMSETSGSRISLDGVSAAPSPLIREVTPGVHRVAVSAKGYHSSEQKVTALDGELVVVPVRLRERPSRVSLSTRPSAQVYIDGAFASQGGAGLWFELPSGTHRVVVAEKGHRVSSQSLELGPGEVRDLEVRLERTTQRKAALTLFIAGGAALGTGVLLSGLTIRAENQAEAFLGRRERGNVTAAELDDYEDTVEERDRYRLATILTLGAAGGLFVTGLFLHELDRPDPNVLYRTERPTSGTRDARLRVLPLVGTNELGAVFQRSF